MSERATAIRAPKTSGRFAIGDHALFVDDGRAELVIIDSDEYPHENSGEPMREVLDPIGDRYTVKASCLGAITAAPVPLQSPRSPRVGSADKDGGRVYASDPYVPHVPGKHPVMEKFDRVRPVPLDNIEIDRSCLSPSQRDRLKDANKCAISANKHERKRGAAILVALHAELAKAKETGEVTTGLAVQQASGSVERVAYPGEHDALPRRLGGLDWLWLKGRIKEHQMLAGLKYSEDYRASEDVIIRSSGNLDRLGGDGSSAQETRLLAQERLTAARAGLLGHGEMVSLCDRVLGKGERLRAIAGGVDAKAVAAEAKLSVALDLLAAHYGIHSA